MKCYDCGFNNASSATVCKGCNGPLDRKVIALNRRPDTDEKLLRERVWTAEYEARRYHLMPKRHDEAAEAFITRINNAKTPYVLAEHAVILQAMQSRQVDRKELPRREPGGGDEQQGASHA